MKELNNMRTHNITTLASEIYDKLANNTNYEQFDINECEDAYVDERAGVIIINYHDKSFKVIITEN